MYRSILGHNTWEVEIKVVYESLLGEMRVSQRFDKNKTVSQMVKHIVDNGVGTIKKIRIRG